MAHKTTKRFNTFEEYAEHFAEKFYWPKVDVKHKDECWLWKASIGNNGAGNCLMSYEGTVLRNAHRVGYYCHTGHIPEDGNDIVLHSCGNNACQNPNHMYLTHRTQMFRDRFVTGKYQSPNHGTHISPETVEQIRNDYANKGLTMMKLVKKYGITYKSINYIINHKTHKVKEVK